MNNNGDFGGSMFATMIEFFDAVGWSYSQMDDEPVLELEFSGDNGDWYCYAAVHEEVDLFVFYSVLPLEVAPEDRDLVAETITRINYSLPVGNFEIDLDAGDVRFKTSIDVEDDRLSRALLQALINANLSTTDRYLPAFDQVLNEGVSPRDAVERIDAEE